MSNTAELFRTGLDLHSSGDLGQAEQVYRKVLQSDPRHAEALHLLGTIALQAGQPEIARQRANEALAIDARQAPFHGTLAEAYRALGKLPEAVASYRAALDLNANDADTHCNLGTVLHMQGNLSEAANCYREAIRLKPEHAAAHCNLGVALQSLREFPAAVTEFREALRLDPNYLDAQIGLGHALRFQGDASEGLACLEAAAKLAPDSVAARYGLGMAYQSQGRLAAAINEFRQAIRISPRFAAAHYKLGLALREQNRDADACECFHAAIAHNPSFIEAYVDLAAVYDQHSNPDTAVAACRRALELHAGSIQAWHMLSCALGHQADVTGAIEACRRTVELAPDHASRHSTLLYTLNFQPECDAAALFAEHLDWARRHAEPLTAQAAPHANDRTPERRLRIGYVSSHFREHAVSFFSEPTIVAHDHKDFEVFCYSEDQRSDAFTDRFRAAADRWVSIGGAADAAVAEQIRLDQIDILVDLAGHLGGNRLGVFARKPAPVQVTYLGYQNTTGMSAMDYRLTDEHADPPGLTEKYYSEQLERLPRTFFCYQPPEPSPEVNDLPALETPHVTFASMNNVLKITPDVLQTWSRILAAVPSSRLRVLAYTGGRFEQDVRNVMAAAGISPDRIEILNKRPRYDYLELHHQHDIALDTFPFNGHTTTCDALWMGVPSIMLEGNSYASRFGGTALVNLGLTDLIGRTRDEYVAIAVALANNLPRLAELRGSLRARMKDSPLLDATGFTRNLEQAYRRMWRKWCESK